MPDITESLAPKSNQLDAVDLASGWRDFTITKADYRPGAEQPVTVHLAEFPRPWKPGKNMRRVLSGCFTTDTDTWAGHRVRLYCDEDVIYAGVKVGGIRISHADVPKALKVPIILTAGKSFMYPVQPLPKAAPPPAEPTPQQLAADVAKGITDATTEAEVREWGNRAHARNLLDFTPEGATETLRQLVTARLAELATPADDVALNDPALDDQP